MLKLLLKISLLTWQSDVGHIWARDECYGNGGINKLHFIGVIPREKEKLVSSLKFAQLCSTEAS